MNNNRNRGGGRGRGRSSGRSNRGFKNKSKDNSTKSKEKEMKFSPQSHGKGSTATYATVKDVLIQSIQKSYKGGHDVAKSLKDMQVIDLTTEEPLRAIATDADAATKQMLQAGMDIKYQEELRRFLDRKDALKEGLTKAYALIFTNYCTRAMQSRIEEHPEFKDKLEDDPIATLEAIKTLMHDPVRAQYPLVSMTDSLGRLLNAKQMENEPLLEYLKRFKQLRDVMKAQLGTRVLDQFVENQEEYRSLSDTTKEKEMKEAAFERWMAYLLLRGSDQTKYGTLLKGFTSQFSLGNDQYPRTIATATDVLSNHRLDQRYYDKQRTNRDKDRADRESNETAGTVTSFAQRQTERVCYCCGKKGHISPYCDKRGTIPREEWHANRAMNHMQDGTDDNASDVSDDNDDDDNESVQSTRSNSSRNRRSGRQNQNQNSNRVGWSIFQTHEFCSFQEEAIVNNQGGKFSNLSDVILLDSGSTLAATFMNPDLVSNVKVSRRPISMATNAGTKTINLEAKVVGYDGHVCFDPTQLANIFGLANLADRHRITYDSRKEDAFLVHTADGTVKFKRTPEGLYAYRPSKEYLRKVAETKCMEPPKDSTGSKVTNLQLSNMIATVTENRKGYTQRQFEDAKRARRLYHIVGCPTVENFKHIIRQNIIKNCPVTIEDINIAEKIFGADIGALKGKTTRRRPTPVKDDLVEVPPELIEQHHDLIFCMDVMYVNGMPMLTGIDRSVKHRSLVPLDDRKAIELYRGLDSIFRFYNGRGFLLKDINCDREFKPLMEEVADELDVKMNYTSKGEHVPEAERNNRTIGERIRATYHNLPYKAIPKVMLKYLAMVSTQQLNLFPAKGGISQYFSPHVIMTGKNLDYNKHCQIPFGAYVQANQENTPTNTNAPRTIDAIYLRPLDNKQGGHELMNLQTGMVITRNRVWEQPVTDLVIKAVETMAEEQGIKSLKLTGRNKIPLHPADWIAGVDYQPNQNEIDDDDDDDEYNPVDDDYESDIELDEAYDRVDQNEIDEILAEPTVPAPAPANHTDDDDANPTNDDAPDADEDTATEPGDTGPDTGTTTRPSRNIPKPDRLTYGPGHKQLHCQAKGKSVKFDDDEWNTLEMCHNLLTQVHPNPEEDVEYSPQLAMVIARVMSDINSKSTAHGASFAQQYIFEKGLKKFKQRGSDAAAKELDQLHRRNCFSPLDVSKMTPQEKRKAMEALMFLTEKRDNTVKGRMVYNGKPTREWLSREDSASPTAALESILLTAIVDAKEGRDVMTADVPNAFIQTKMPEVKDGEERVTMKITGVLVDLLVEMAPEVYGPYVVFEKGRKTLYVEVLRALYGMLIASLLWYKQFKSDLEGEGFVFNPYDACVANKLVKDKQHTIRFHVDDLMCSHVDSKVNTRFLKWLNKMYGSHGEVKATRGPIHDYLGMTFDFSEPGKLKLDMIDYMSAMVDDFSTEFKPSDTAPSPAADDLFNKGTSQALDKFQAEEFHTFVAKGLFACKRARPDIHPTIAALCTRVKDPNQDDWKKLHRLLQYVNGTRNDKLILSADDLHVIKWYVDSSFAVHPDFKSHTGGAFTYGRGTPLTMSRKQKLNTRSSTEAELVGADDMSVMILWTKLFMEAQGYDIKKNILYQDNKSTILLEENGKRSSSKRTRAFNIRYFFLTDQIEKGKIQVEYCPTTEMIADYMTKPLQGKLFEKFRKMIMGH